MSDGATFEQRQAYDAVRSFLREFGEEAGSSDILLLWNCMKLNAAGHSADLAVLDEWLACWGSAERKDAVDVLAATRHFVCVELWWSLEDAVIELFRALAHIEAGRNNAHGARWNRALAGTAADRR